MEGGRVTLLTEGEGESWREDVCERGGNREESACTREGGRENGHRHRCMSGTEGRDKGQEGREAWTGYLTPGTAS